MPPSGLQIELRSGTARAVVVEVGGGVRRFDVDGVAVLDGYDEQDMVTGARGQPLLPWPNRLHTGRYTWDGTEHEVPLDEPAQSNALHGLTRWRSWTAEDVADDRVTMRLRLHPSPPYPFALDLSVRYDLAPGALTVTTTATNVGDADAPWGAGAHPYVTVGTAFVDDVLLQVPARTWLPTGPAQIPVGREPVDGTPYDFRSARPIGKVRIDHAFADLERDADARARVVLEAPQGRRVDLWVDEHYPYVEVFTGDTLPEQGRRRTGLGLEPMTCPPDAFRTGEDLVRLVPGQTWRGSWGIETAH